MRKKIFIMLAVWGVAAITASAAPSMNPQKVPLVYRAENTGIDCPLPSLPTVDLLPSIVRLPNPFKMENGNKISSFDQWECRRNEIKAQIERYEIGVKPPRPQDISATYADGTLTVIVKDNGKTVTLTSKVTMPTGDGPFPIIIGMNSPTGSLPASIFNGFIQIPFMHDQASIYGSSPQGGPFYDMYPELAAAGQYCAWSWGVSRLIDGIELVQKDLNADLEHIGVTGCSYAGKMALFAGAFDERIALTIAQESGGGGTASWRVSETLGSVENLSSTNYTWFMQALKDNFDKKVDKLPYDHHELIAMIAPRAFLSLGNDILWLADESGYVSCMAAKEVWKFMGVPDRIGFDLTGGHGHCSAPDSQVASATSFVDRFLRGNEEVNTNIAINNYTKTNYQFWISDWANNIKEPDVPLESYWYEGEGIADDCTSIGSDFTTGDDANASNGSYIIEKDNLSSIDAAPGSNGLIAIPFTINNHRDFHIYFHVNCSDDGSFWIKIDDGPFVSYDVLNTNDEWKWVNIVNPTLLAGIGNHTLTIGYRSGGIKLDKVNITNDPTQVPDGIGEKETECIQIPPCSIIDFETGNIDGWIRQNPGGGISITQEDKHSGEYAMKMVSRGGSAWSVQAFSPAFDMISGHTYNVTFWVRAVDGDGRGRISTTGAGQLGSSQYWADFNVGDEWQQISYPNLVAGGSSIQLSFDMGYVAKTYYIDDIVLEDITVNPNPALRVQGAEWNAGQVAINENLQSGKFNIRNIGTGILDVTGITELATPWSTSLEIGDGLSLGAGQVQEFTFTYAPTTVGVSTTDFAVETNIGNAVIELKGEGVEGTGIPTIENLNVKIFSIPGKINITAPVNSKIKISDMIGKAIGTYNIYKSPLELSLYSGIYAVSVEYGNKTYTQKVIVK